MKRFNNLWLLGIVVCATVLISMGTASANPVLKFSNGSDTFLVPDNSSSDLNSESGVIVYVGDLFAHDNGWSPWSSVTTIGVSGGTPNLMELSSNLLSRAGGANFLEISYSDTFNSPNPLQEAITKVGGYTDGTVEFNSTILSLGPYSGSFSDTSVTTGLNIGAPYLLTLEADITQWFDQSISTFGQTVSVAEPSTLILLGSGLAGLAGLGAWRRK